MHAEFENILLLPILKHLVAHASAYQTNADNGAIANPPFTMTGESKPENPRSGQGHLLTDELTAELRKAPVGL